MKCGVKFCGGCNPHYERGEAYRKIVTALPDIDFAYAEDGSRYDVLLLICGCTACCASYDAYVVEGEVIKIWSQEQIESTINKLNITEEIFNEKLEGTV